MRSRTAVSLSLATLLGGGFLQGILTAGNHIDNPALSWHMSAFRWMIEAYGRLWAWVTLNNKWQDEPFAFGQSLGEAMVFVTGVIAFAGFWAIHRRGLRWRDLWKAVLAAYVIATSPTTYLVHAVMIVPYAGSVLVALAVLAVMLWSAGFFRRPARTPANA